jgi:hypothetical protein
MIDLLKRGVADPRGAVAFVKRQALFGGSRIWHRRIRRRTGVRVMEEDWDNLIILDACRYDAFESVVEGLPGRLSKRISSGSSSVEWIRNTFDDESFYDTVYITANPYIELETNDAFHDTWHAWQTHWNEEHGTVMPAAMAELAREAEERYPDKRLIVHFMQPHRPFIGARGRRLETSGIEKHRRRALGEDDGEDDENVFGRLRNGEIDRETVWEAYVENLRVVLPYVEDLLDDIRGKTVVTADHGNGFGERAFGGLGRIYAHPAGVFTPQLVEVPWHTADGTRKRIVSDPPKREREATGKSDEIESRLEALGYK